MTKPSSTQGRIQAPTEALAEELRRAVSRFVRVVRDKAGTEKSAQSEALVLLERDGAMNIAAMAQRRKVTHQTMRVVVNQLEKAGWVERLADPQDGRSQLIALSNAGRAELRRARRARSSKIDAMIDKTLSDQERDQLRFAITLLDRLSAAAED
jgi:DNA-binding MarR family transcriptional regulator